MTSSIKSYYRLAKPGIIYGNSMHFLAAALFASALSGTHIVSLIAGLVGTALIIGSACVVNCISDRHLDALMERTKNRPLPSGEVTVHGAVIYAIILLALGAGVIVWLSNLTVLGLSLLCWFTYTVVYGYVKRHSWMGTMVGTIPGALPVLAGYAVVDPTLPATAWTLTLAILVWQLPHFYGLSLYRRDDYAKSRLPMLSVVKPRKVVMQHITATVLLYFVAVVAVYLSMPTLATRIAAGVMLLGAAWWAAFILRGKDKGSDKWARAVFGKSLVLSIVFALAGIIAVAITLVFTVQ